MTGGQLDGSLVLGSQAGSCLEMPTEEAGEDGEADQKNDLGERAPGVDQSARFGIDHGDVEGIANFPFTIVPFEALLLRHDGRFRFFRRRGGGLGRRLLRDRAAAVDFDEGDQSRGDECVAQLESPADAGDAKADEAAEQKQRTGA